MKVLPNIGKNDNNDISFPLRLRCLPTTNEPRLERSFDRSRRSGHALFELE